MQEPKAKTKAALPPPPAGTEDIVLVDINQFASIGNASVSKVQEEVRAGRAPEPVIREPRFTRWRLKDVREYWQKRITEGSGDAADAVVEKAKKASKAAKEKRAQTPQPAQHAAGPRRPHKGSKYGSEIASEQPRLAARSASATSTEKVTTPEAA